MERPGSAKPGQAVELCDGLTTILAPNPSPMTYMGTNTYILGSRDLAVIDPGPPEDAHLDAILAALKQHQRISHIFVTHSHIDHSPLAMVLAMISGARVHAYGDSRAGRSAAMAGLGALGGGEGIDESFLPDVKLADGAEISGSDWTLRAHHTPGHMGNHMCFEWREGQALFSGDHVMGWASSMVSPPDGDLTDFMTSLEKLSAIEGLTRYFPGHGAAIEDPSARVAELLAHRRKRESQILDALSIGGGNPADLAARIYTDVAPELLPAAARNVLAHLIDLKTKGLVMTEAEPGPDTHFERCS